jgi:hypothetical protein
MIRFAVVLTLEPSPWVAVGGANAKDMGEATGEEFAMMLVMLMLVIFCNWLESLLKLGVEESALELELDVCVFRVELVWGMEGGLEDLEDLDRTEEVNGGWEKGFLKNLASITVHRKFDNTTSKCANIQQQQTNNHIHKPHARHGLPVFFSDRRSLKTSLNRPLPEPSMINHRGLGLGVHSTSPSPP